MTSLSHNTITALIAFVAVLLWQVVALGQLPDRKLTPGDVFAHVTLEQIKQPGYSKTVRDVPESVKHEVARRYGVDPAKLAGFEVDHLIPLCIGGSNEVTNLWPEPYAGKWGARTKDRLEVHCLAMIRAGQMDLHAAQRDIARDWKAMYRRVIGTRPKSHLSEAHEQ